MIRLRPLSSVFLLRPTADSEVTLTGAVGSVAPYSAVVAATLETGQFHHGSSHSWWEFYGDSVCPRRHVRPDQSRPGRRELWQRFVDQRPGRTRTSVRSFSTGEQGGDSTVLASLPGTILHVPDPPGRRYSGRQCRAESHWQEQGLAGLDVPGLPQYPDPHPRRFRCGSAVQFGWIPPPCKELNALQANASFQA